MSKVMQSGFERLRWSKIKRRETRQTAETQLHIREVTSSLTGKSKSFSNTHTYRMYA